MFSMFIDEAAEENDNFRKVVWTGEYQQLVLMKLQPGEDIGSEVHKATDQIIKVVSGSCKAVIDDEEKELNSGDIVAIPAGSRHNIINSESEDLALYTIYSPPHHAPDKVDVTKP